MARVFISYRSTRRPAARYLQRVLAQYGFDSWYDYGLLPGEDFERRLFDELGQAQCCIVLWCSLSATSEWVLKEAREAQRLGTYLPVRIEATPLPLEFRDADTINLSAWDGSPRNAILDRLLADVGRRLAQQPTPNFAGLRTLHEDWEQFGKPSLAQFALGAAIALHEGGRSPREWLADVFARHVHRRLYVHPNIPSAFLNRARTAWGLDRAESELLALIDTSNQNDCYRGVAFLEDGLISKLMDAPPQFYSYATLKNRTGAQGLQSVHYSGIELDAQNFGKSNLIELISDLLGAVETKIGGPEDRRRARIVSALRRVQQKSLYVAPHVPAAAQSRMASVFPDMAAKEILGFLDTSAWGNCNSGFWFLEDGLLQSVGFLETINSYTLWEHFEGDIVKGMASLKIGAMELLTPSLAIQPMFLALSEVLGDVSK